MPSPTGNCAIRVVEKIAAHPEKLALWSARSGMASFRNIGERAAYQQRLARSVGLTSGDTVLVVALPGADLYATLIALMGLGVGVVFIEPWMASRHLDAALSHVSIKALFADHFGRIWRLRNRSLRHLPCYSVALPPDVRDDAALFAAVSVDPSLPAIVSFTTGTTGAPKGVVRTHGYLWDLHEILEKYGEDADLPGTDLTIFPNMALYNLGCGRGSLLIPPNWSLTALQRIRSLDKSLWPQSLSCGPAFLRHLLDCDLAFASLKSIHVGGALVECELLERAAIALPRARIRQVYGGTEVEPISFVDAKVSLELSRAKGFAHALYVGRAISELSTRFDGAGSLWVSGINVCPEYLGNASENALHKMRDEQGKLWHGTGDRIIEDNTGFWYMGRSDQGFDDFIGEQKLYAQLGHTRAFVRRDASGSLQIVADDDTRIVARAASDVFKEAFQIWTAVMLRDRRHRSRIDRRSTWERGLRMVRWWTYVKERSPLPVLTFLAAGPIVSGLLFTSTTVQCNSAAENSLEQCVEPSNRFLLGLVAVLASILFMIEARMMDELKDFEKDKSANPLRPLPRGLISPSEMAKGVRLGMFILVVFSILLAALGTLWSGVLFLAASLYLWLMFKEFYVGERLNQFPLLYALSHQVVGVPLYLFGVSLFAIGYVSFPGAWFYVGVNVAASLSYEFSRKLKPDAHPAALTYRQIYGLPIAASIAFAFQGCAIGLSLLWSADVRSVFWLALVQIPTALAIAAHAKRDGLHKLCEGLAALSLLAAAWSGLLLFLRF